MDASYIEVKVEDGVVTLSGSVKDQVDKIEAKHCLEYIIGVIDIQNDLNISGQVFS